MRFLKSIQQDAKLFLYIYLLLMLFRIAFLAIYAGQMGSAGVGGYFDRALVGCADQSQDDGVLGCVPVSFRYDPVCVLLEVAGGRYPKGAGECRNFFDDVPLYGAYSVL